jgi:hypothetical protein
VEAKVADEQLAKAILEVNEAASNAVAALAERWVRVDLTADEEQAIRRLNDALQALDKLDYWRAYRAALDQQEGGEGG